ncbi:hypothetical protein LOC68_08010 [Blastopirellula sp. JC732]|uniref:Uncharacterized protein n=1 Tax=Blastopirellula sediminis TaxID=2894196 RepID=A0A9X1MKN9_9BACT|nr:hypothetical protein [Blastopirellula sediminis]MCC9608887.1 hypothetical protein [Blastopirellula sediminis]MCC9628336.1 hypothetical protein [Blastopirellula sediminis]
MSETEHVETQVAPEVHVTHQAPLPAQADDLNTPVIAVVGFVSAILTFAIVMGLQAGYHQFANALRTEKVITTQTDQSAAVIAAQKATMNSYGWVDKQAGKVSLPIDRAMQLVVNEYSTKAK